MGGRRGRPSAVVAALLVALALTSACGAEDGPGHPVTPSGAGPASTSGPDGEPLSLDVTAPEAAPATGPSGSTGSPGSTGSARSTGPAVPKGSTASAVLAAAVADGSLRGKVVVIDPGHNGANGRNSRVINRKVDIGNGVKACDTTGTETNGGYAEAAFTFDVSVRLATLLRSTGATVVLTRPDNRGVGPCINQRAGIGNTAHADAAISIHGDGAPAAGHGFHVIVPKGIGRNDAIVTPSKRLGISVRDAFRSGTGQPLSTYTGTRTGGLVTRSDLGGLNLSTVPKVFIECGNMRNATDARRMGSPAWRQRAATALAAGLTTFLTAEH